MSDGIRRSVEGVGVVATGAVIGVVIAAGVASVVADSGGSGDGGVTYC